MWSAVRCLRCTNFFFCVFTMCIGLACIGVGLYVQNALPQQDNDLLHKLCGVNQFPLFLVTGSFVLGGSFFGCWGSLAENKYLIAYFIVVSFVCLLMESVQLNTQLLLKQVDKDAIADVIGYRMRTCEEADITYWTYLQNWGRCCGVYNGTSWQEVPKECSVECSKNPPFTAGCLDKLEQSIKLEATILSYFMSVVIPCQVTVIVISFILLNLVILREKLKKKRPSTDETESEEAMPES